jgi:hypothetical protein
MKKIGQGWQCLVYDLENGRVFKREKPLWRQFLTILVHGGPQEILKGGISRVRRDYRHSLAGLYEILKNSEIDASRFGNPDINVTALSYTQDKVIPVHAIFKIYSFEEKKKFFIKYVELLQYLWGFGIYEKIFNFHLNIGIAKQGKLVLIDLGELSFEREDALKGIIKKGGYDHILFP